MFLQQFYVQFVQSMASDYFTMLDAQVSELFHSFRYSRGECLPSNSMCKPYVQKVQKLLKLESSISSIIQALVLTSITQALSAQRAKRASMASPHSHLPSKRPALEDSHLTPSIVSAKTTSSHETLFE